MKSYNLNLNRIESTLEQTRKELAAKRSLEKAKQDQLQMQVDSLEKSIEQLVSHPLFVDFKQPLCFFKYVCRSKRRSSSRPCVKNS